MTGVPQPLPPEERPVGQLIAESVRLYGRRFWPSLALGVAPAASGVVGAALPGAARVAYSLTVGTLVITCAYGAAVVIASGVQPTRRSAAVALLCGVVVWLPVPFLATFLIFHAAAWLGAVGLVVPVALIEGTGVRQTVMRALRLARADYVHAFGSIATLVIVGLLTALSLFFVLRGQGEATLATAAFLSVLVISPLLFLGGALLYFDQAARYDAALRARGRRRR